jgi:hypothetical protein
VVAVQVSIDGEHQPQIERLDQAQIEIELVSDRIDEQRLPTPARSDQVGKRARFLVRQLPKQHRLAASPGAPGRASVTWTRCSMTARVRAWVRAALAGAVSGAGA